MLLSRIGRSNFRALIAVQKHQQAARCVLSIGRMLDMGGMPSASSDQSILRVKDASKNSKVQAVVFDFECLTRAIAETPQPTELPIDDTAKKIPDKLPAASAIQPDLNQIQKIQQIASVLNVSLGTEESTSETPPPPKKKALSQTHVGQDVRAKYAAKLKGGLAGVELAKSRVHDTLKGGDAAGHLAARKMAVKETAASPAKWFALTGTGRLLSYLTHRSIRIALLPNPRLEDVERQKREFKYMTDFSTQMKDVVMDTVVHYEKINTIESMLKKGILDEMGIHPNKILLVSDKDEYLKAAKDLGIFTIRLLPKNARRGNVTAHYNTPDVPGVQEIVNEISGISFNAVLNR
jgi:hypothetical protein